jgi:hypothetical protein
MVDAEAVRERATVSHYEPPVFGLEEPMWVAEDDENDCVGVGRVEAEAVGNLVAVVGAHGHDHGGHVKLPGRVIERTWRGDEEGLLDRLHGWL